MDPIKIAADYFDRDRHSDLRAERIKNGLTNESWLVRAQDEAVVVRFSNRDIKGLQIDRQSETQILAIVAAAGIGPQVLLCAPERRLLVTRFIAGRTWSSRDTRIDENLTRVGHVLRALHALPVPQEVQITDLRKIVCDYWSTLMSRGLGAHVGTPEIRERALQLAAQLESDAILRLCHNDVHHLNVIDDGRLWLIDWEYAGIGDTYFDLASVCCYHALGDDFRRVLLRAYLGQDNSAAFDRLQRMCWLFNYIRDLWFAVREME